MASPRNSKISVQKVRMWLACSRKQLYEKDTYEYLFKSSEKYRGVEVGSQRTPQHRRDPSSHDDMLQSPYLEVGRPEEPLKSKAANLPRHHKTIRWRLPLENVAFESISQTWTKVSWALCLREMTQGKTVHLCQVSTATEASLPLSADFAAVTSHWSVYCTLIWFLSANASLTTSRSGQDKGPLFHPSLLSKLSHQISEPNNENT